MVVVTCGVQIAHFWQIAAEMQLEREVQEGLGRAVLASIGPSASEELRRRGLVASFEASHPKMGILVRKRPNVPRGLLKSKR